MRPKLGIIALLLVVILTAAAIPKANAKYPWPPLKVHLDSQVDGWNLTFLITLENLTDRPLEGLTIKAVPARFTRETTRLVDSWAGSPGQNPGVFDGVAVGWIHDELAPRSQEGPFAFTVNFERSAQATFAAYSWVSWTGPVPGAFTSEELAVTSPPPEPPARPIAVKRLWISSGWNTPPQTRFTDIQDISYVVDLEDYQPGDLIEFRVYDQATGQLAAASGNRIGVGSEGSYPPGVKAQAGGGIRRLPPGAYRAEMYTNGRRQGETIAFEVVPYTGPPSICRGIGTLGVNVDSALAEDVAGIAAAAGGREGGGQVGPKPPPGQVHLIFNVSPEVGPQPNPRDKAMEETERILASIRERLLSLGVPKENIHTLQTAPDCRLVGPSPWGTPPAPTAPGA